jgi:hypothetical protein
MRFPCATFYLFLVSSFHECIARTAAFPKYGSIHATQDTNTSFSSWEAYLAIFDQLIDHNDPSLGTFPQRYWWSTQFYEYPGSPVRLSVTIYIVTTSDYKSR